jgi:uncharacterized protein (DUF488 family)
MTIDVFSIGHSNLPAARFVQLLQHAGVQTIADVRSTPASRFCPWFSRKPLEQHLARAGIAYAFYGDTLGGRPGDAHLYCDGVADYEAMAAQSAYGAGLDRLMAAAEQTRVCMMCAEREPLDCHRCLLLARSLAKRGLPVGHILHDGATEPHAATEARLLTLENETPDLFASGQGERIAAAYRRRAHHVAFRRRLPQPRVTRTR